MPAPGREQARPEVPAALERVGQDGRGRREGEQEQQRRPPVEHVGRRLGGPAEGGGPGQGAAADGHHVAQGAQGERGTEHETGQPGRAPGVGAQLGRGRGDPGEGQPDQRDGGRHDDRPGDRPAVGHGQRADHDSRQQVGDDRHDERRGERRLTADHVGPHQLRTPALLLEPGVPGDQHDVHQRGQEQQVEQVAGGEEAGVGGVLHPVGGTGEEPAHRLLHHRGHGGQVGLRRSQLGQGRPQVDHEQPQPTDPGGQLDAVPPQHQPDQRPGARRGPVRSVLQDRVGGAVLAVAGGRRPHLRPPPRPRRRWARRRSAA
ncbi:hypothetical protein [Ornithinimicrobium kibberense]|uniref:hypothetical protein n=1 Tax=Ornithinimicrobium kibberense TaxID=282060 RepID=UPI00360622D8